MLHGQVQVDLIVSSITWKLHGDKDIVYLYTLTISLGFSHSSVGKESACNAGDPGLISGQKICWRKNRLPTPVFLGFPCGSAGKESICNAGDLGSIPGLGRSPGEGKGNPLQYSGLENSTDCIVYGVMKSRTWLSNFHFHFSPSLYLLYLSLCLAYNNSNNLAVMIITKLQWILYSFWIRHFKMLCLYQFIRSSQQPFEGETIKDGLPSWCSGKESTCQCRRQPRHSLGWEDPLE